MATPTETGTFLDDAAAQARQLATLTTLSERFGQSLAGAFSSATTSGKGLDDVLGSIGSRLAGAIGGSAASALQTGLTGAAQSLTSAASLASFGGDAFGFAKGGAFASGLRVQPFAAGGVVSSPTYFPMAGGLGLMGEAGPEAVMPLSRATDGRLGIRGGGAGATTINVAIQASDLDSFKRSETQVSAALARAVARGRRAT